ncbi:uncharacterized protein LOC130710677 [Lotus japonicus]|uniref:uncharacterized protein LOC130710677 n=1 Tax=Lotus japonicus TaxID=34305 RepID=UPI002590F9DE|nr:uncharacterized protein LOC130710677 [Lotus japonicus]
MNPINLTQTTDIDSPMVIIHDINDCAVFPPINHENLSNQDTPQSPSPPPSSSSSSSCLTTDSDTWVDPHVRKGGDFTGWVSFGFQFLRSKLSSFWNRGAAFWLIGWLPAAAVVFSCWILVMMAKKNRRRRRSLTPNETRLINIITEKDGRIAQLLNQIAQMNEILIARHKALAAKVVE